MEYISFFIKNGGFMIKIIFLILPFLIMLLPNRDYDLMSKEDTLAFKGIFSIVVILPMYLK